MKIYICYSKETIKIKNKNELCTKVAKAVNEKFDLFNNLCDKDVVLVPSRLSDDYDVYIIMDEKVPGINVDEWTTKCKVIKEIVCSFLQEDQENRTNYKTALRVDPQFKLDAAMTKQQTGSKESENNQEKADDSELDYEKRAQNYVPVEPSYSFDRVILPEDVLEKLYESLSILQYERKVFDEWGLYEIQPHPSSSLSFFGPSGTGKTMAAEAIAQKLGKKILKVSYADVESKYHGEGPKMVKAIFLAAEKEDAVLFFDEADSLLSKRLTNVTQGSEQAINSMRSQLLICLEEFKGIVIFATNLVVNYDQAFLTRLISVEFKFPDVPTRKKIWDVHIRPVNDGFKHKLNIPLAEDVDTAALAEKYVFAGREIRNAVISACIRAAIADKDIVCQDDFVKACDKIVSEKESVAKAGDHTLNDKAKNAIKEALLEKVEEKKTEKLS